MSGTELSSLSKMPQQTVSRHLNGLVRQNILDYTKQGRNKLYYLDYSKPSTKSVIEVLENHKGINFQQKAMKAFSVINEFLKRADSLIVFGSYASHTFDKSSDLDIVFVGKCDKQAVKRIKRMQAMQVNEHYASYEEFAKLLGSENPLAIEILENHIIFGNVSRVVDIFMRRYHE